MADFLTAVRMTLEKEGGYVDDPADTGGPTKLGITLATLRSALGKDLDGDGWLDADYDHDGDVDADDVKAMPRDDAERIYRARYWDSPGFYKIPDDRLAAKVFDIGVNASPRVAVVLLQRTIDRVMPPGLLPVRDDGDLGPATLSALSYCDVELVLAGLAQEQKGFYERCIEHDPNKRVFRRNWLARARWIPRIGAA